MSRAPLIVPFVAACVVFASVVWAAGKGRDDGPSGPPRWQLTQVLPCLPYAVDSRCSASDMSEPIAGRNLVVGDSLTGRFHDRGCGEIRSAVVWSIDSTSGELVELQGEVDRCLGLGGRGGDAALGVPAPRPPVGREVGRRQRQSEEVEGEPVAATVVEQEGLCLGVVGEQGDRRVGQGGAGAAPGLEPGAGVDGDRAGRRGVGLDERGEPDGGVDRGGDRPRPARRSGRRRAAVECECGGDTGGTECHDGGESDTTGSEHAHQLRCGGWSCHDLEGRFPSRNLQKCADFAVLEPEE